MHQLDRIEAMLTDLTNKAEAALPPSQPGMISVDFVRQTAAGMFKALIDDRKIEAIKACRQLTGMGLKESKDAIEHLYSCLGRKVA